MMSKLLLSELLKIMSSIRLPILPEVELTMGIHGVLNNMKFLR